MRSKAPPPPEGAPLEQSATWPVPPKDPPAEVDEMEVEDANLPWKARGRRLIAKMENSEKKQVGISEMEHFQLHHGFPKIYDAGDVAPHRR